MKVVRGKILKNMIKMSYTLKKTRVQSVFVFNYIFFLGKTGSLTQVLLGIEQDVCFHSTSVLFPRVLFVDGLKAIRKQHSFHGILKKLVNTRYSFRLRS